MPTLPDKGGAPLLDGGGGHAAAVDRDAHRQPRAIDAGQETATGVRRGGQLAVCRASAGVAAFRHAACHVDAECGWPSRRFGSMIADHVVAVAPSRRGDAKGRIAALRCLRISLAHACLERRAFGVGDVAGKIDRFDPGKFLFERRGPRRSGETARASGRSMSGTGWRCRAARRCSS